MLHKWLLTTVFCVVNAFTLYAANPVVVFETTQGSFEVTLYPEIAPKAVENFLTHVQDQYYDGLIFHCVNSGYCIQSGSPLGANMGGHSIWGTDFEDEFNPSVNFDHPGILAMANDGPNTNRSQFFITTSRMPWNNQKFTIFGDVTAGYNIVKKIERVPVGVNNRPIDPQVIIQITVKQG